MWAELGAAYAGIGCSLRAGTRGCATVGNWSMMSICLYLIHVDELFVIAKSFVCPQTQLPARSDGQ